MRKRDPVGLAQLYEADDHVLFADKRHKRTKKLTKITAASETSSQKGSTMGSARRRKAKRRHHGHMGETGSAADNHQVLAASNELQNTAILKSPE